MSHLKAARKPFLQSQPLRRLRSNPLIIIPSKAVQSQIIPFSKDYAVSSANCKATRYNRSSILKSTSIRRLRRNFTLGIIPIFSLSRSRRWFRTIQYRRLSHTFEQPDHQQRPDIPCDDNSMRGPHFHRHRDPKPQQGV